MRIALVCPYAWDRPGGVQVHVGQLARELRARGHRVAVLAPGGREGPGIVSVGRVVGIRYQGTVAPVCLSPAAAARVRSTLRSLRPDVVHVHEPFVPVVGLAATLTSPAPVVGTFHAFAERSRALSVLAPALRPAWRRLAVRIAVSGAASTFVGERFDGEVRVIPNGCAVDAFAGATPDAGLPAGRCLAWVGRIDPQKGFPVALRAFARLVRDRADLWFIVAGDGADRAALAGIAPEVRRRVVMLGSVPHARLPGYLAGADAFVGPALGQESFGIVLVEAMAAGVPVIASDIPGYREVIRAGVDGLLVPPGDDGALADAIAQVLDDGDLATRLRSAGPARAEGFSWRAVVPRIEAAYADARSARGVRRRS